MQRPLRPVMGVAGALVIVQSLLGFFFNLITLLFITGIWRRARELDVGPLWTSRGQWTGGSVRGREGSLARP